MNRTYNFQVDNGLFVAEYYLKKPYTDITLEDLENNVSLFAAKLHGYNSLSTLSYASHQNSSLTQGKANEREDRITNQLKTLITNVGSDKVCSVCGEKRVNISGYLDDKGKKKQFPYSSLMFGLPSQDNFMNRGNNLRTIDVCPVCLFLSLLSFLNTQKISFPFVYLSDSDDFMRDATAEIQVEASKKILLDAKVKDLDKHFIHEITELLLIEEDNIYEDLGYVNLILYQNGKSNMYSSYSIEKDKILFILRVKAKGLLGEFYKLGLFRQILKGTNLFKYLAKHSKIACSKELYKLIKGEAMKNAQLNLKLVEEVANRLVASHNKDEVITDLNLVKNKGDFKKFLIQYQKETPLCDTLTDINELIEKYYDYKDYLVLVIQMKGDK